jgi:hypothetical protein
VPPRKHVAKIQLFFGLEYENQVFLHKIRNFGIKDAWIIMEVATKSQGNTKCN